MKSPFKFLDSYTREDRSVFFGRDQEITDLYRRVFESKMLLVYGISGTGKSSLVNCGLASRFDESDWLPLNVRRGNNIVDSLNDAFNKEAITKLRKNQSLSEKLQSIYLDHFKPVYLLFDQFEELFIFGNQEEKTEFISTVKELTESETQCRIIFIIREEFLAGMTEFEEKLPDIFTNRFRVEKMKRANAISAVIGPCKVFGIETEAGFSEELVDKLIQSGQEIELTYLQIYLDRIFRIAIDEKKEDEKLIFSKILLTKAGSVSDLLGQFLEEQIGEMEDPGTTMTILKSFVSVQGTKKQMTEPEISDAMKAFGTELTEQGLIRYLNKFVDLRILREKDETGKLELRHDALAAKIYEQFTLSEKELLEVRQFVGNAYQTFFTRRTYLSYEDLEYLAPYEKRLYLSPELDQFIRQSKDKLQAQQRALKRLTQLVAVLFLILVALGVRYYFNQKGTTKTRDLITLALLQEKVDPLASINTALKIRNDDTTTAIVPGIILNSFYKLLQDRIQDGDTIIPVELKPFPIPVSDSICSLRISKAGTHLYGWTSGNEIFLWHVGDLNIKTFKTSGPILQVEISGDAKYFSVVYLNNTGEVYSAGGRKIFPFIATANYLMNERLVRFFPSGKYFHAAVNGNMAQIYDSAGTCLFNLEGHTGNINSLDISPDGRFVVTASSDKKTIIWNFNHKTQRFSPYDTIIRHRDTVWSCEFTKSGKFILTTSADSTIRISYLTGSLRYSWFLYATNNQMGISSFNAAPEGHMIYDSSIYDLKLYNKKVCNACFAADETALIATNYGYDIKDEKNKRGANQIQIIYFGQSANDNIYLIDPFFKKAKQNSINLSPPFYMSWSVAPDRYLFAGVPVPGKIVLTAVNGYHLAEISGNFPLYSGDGRYLYFLDGKEIRILPLKLEEIRAFVFEEQIFGDPEEAGEPWLLL